MAKPIQIVSEEQLDAELKALLEILKEKNPDIESPDGWPSELPKPAEQMVGPEDDPQPYITTFMVNNQPHAAFLARGEDGQYNRFQLYTQDQLRSIYDREVTRGITDKINRDINPITNKVPENAGVIEELSDGSKWRHGPLDDPAVVQLQENGHKFAEAVGAAANSAPKYEIDAAVIEKSALISFSKEIAEPMHGQSISMDDAQAQVKDAHEAPMSKPVTPFDIEAEKPMLEIEEPAIQGLVDLSPLLPAYAIDADPSQQLQAAHDAAVTALDHMKWSYLPHEPDDVKLRQDQIEEIIEDYETDYPGFANVLRQAHTSLEAGQSPAEVWSRGVDTLFEAQKQLGNGIEADMDEAKALQEMSARPGVLPEFADLPVLKENFTFISVSLEGVEQPNHILWQNHDGEYVLYGEQDFMNIINGLHHQDFEYGQDYAAYMQRLGNSMNALAQVNGGVVESDFQLSEAGDFMKGEADPRVQAAFLRHRDFDGDMAAAQNIETELEQAIKQQEPSPEQPQLEQQTPQPAGPEMKPDWVGAG